MKIAVTGASGGVGRGVVAEALSRGHEVVGIDRVLPENDAEQDGLVFIQANITDYDQLLTAFAGCDALIHMAAIPNPMHDPDHVVHNNNVVGSYNAMRAAIELGITLICQASSVNAIGFSFSREPCHEYFPLDEEHPNHNEDAYALSKWISEQQADSLVRRCEAVQIASMRFPLVVTDRGAPDRDFNRKNKPPSRHLWSYTLNSSRRVPVCKVWMRISKVTRCFIFARVLRRARRRALNLQPNSSQAFRLRTILAGIAALSVLQKP